MSRRADDAALARLESIAVARLDAARALLALSSGETAVLDAVDRAGRGECASAESERVLSAHLARREAAIAAIARDGDEWSTLVAALPEGAAAGTALASLVDECRALLARIDASDAAFARELAARRDAARAEIGRADDGRAAHRAYGARPAPAPRFTDRSA
ncbi:MAG: hypothetical protein RI967_1200 [Planctomycetota bacterium]